MAGEIEAVGEIRRPLEVIASADDRPAGAIDDQHVDEQPPGRNQRREPGAQVLPAAVDHQRRRFRRLVQTLQTGFGEIGSARDEP